MRLHELAKEIGAESKILLGLAKELGLKARNHSATLTEGEIALLKAAWREEHGDAAPVATAEPVVEKEKPALRTRKSRKTAETEGESEAPAEGFTEFAESAEGQEGGEPQEYYEAGEDEGAAEEYGEQEPILAGDDSGSVASDEAAEPDMSEAGSPATSTAVAEEAVAAEAAGTTAPRTETAPPAPSAPAPKAAPRRSPSMPSLTPLRPAGGAGNPQSRPGAPARPGAPGRQAPGVGGQPMRPAARGPGGPGTSGAPGSGPRRAGGLPGTSGTSGTSGPAGPGGHGSAPGTAAEGAQQAIKRPSRPGPGAKILGRIELPAEELRRQKALRSGPGPGAPGGSTSTYSSPGGTAAPPGSRIGPGRPGAAETEAEAAKRRGAAGRDREDIAVWNPDDEDDPLLQSIRMRQAGAAHARRPPRRVGPKKGRKPAPPPVPTGPVPITVPISIRDLSALLGAKVTALLRILLGAGHTVGTHSVLNEDAVLELAASLGREVQITAHQNREQTFLAEVDAMEKKLAASDVPDRLGQRPPVVAFLGHVDHGKTSLLDRIRSANVAAGEAGGITQSMRAYSVTAPSGQKITFLDTPGHKAFTEMRARGAHVTDIVVLVVAADDGVMPQTEEAIQHAKAAGCPIVVALNKIDRPQANADRVLQQLAQVGVLVEAWGGDVQVAPTSAITGQGIEDLLEKIALQAEVMDLKADVGRDARGTVIEARKDEQLGAIATVLVQEGTLKVGDVVLSGSTFGRVRKLIADDGTAIEEALPSTPVNILGLNEAPDASAPFFVVENLKQARDVASEREHARNKDRNTVPARSTVTLENLFANLEAGKAEEVLVVLRCDVKGSLEVVKKELESLATKEVKIKIIRDALGGITEDDVLLAIASKASVIGFNVVADDKARALAEARGVDVRSYQIIYELVDDVKAAMEGKLSPIQREQVIGHVEIREIFKVSKIGTIAGCLVRDGLIKRNSKIRLTRDGRIIHNGKLDSLKRFKDDVREVKEGMECGLKIDGYDDIKVGDIVEAFEVQEEKRTLDFSAGA
jgi:translation initiation factor IF-2